MLTKMTSLLLLLVLAACSNQSKPVGFTPDDAGTDAAVLPPDTIVVDAGEMRDSGLSWDASSPDSSVFNELPPLETTGPCANAAVWPPTDETLYEILVNAGDYVVENGHLYQYIYADQQLTWPQPDCRPSNPTRYDCMDGKWWVDTGLDC